MMIAVAEVDPAALGVRQVPVLEDLEQDVEDLRVGLLDLVEQDDAVALAADRLGQLAALVEADVAGRRADEPAHVVALHELAHVDLDERVLAAEHELGERLGELGLPDAGRAEEDERADRALRVLEAGAGAADGLRDDLDRLLLADDPAVERRPPCGAAARTPPAAMRVTGMPVHIATTWAISSSSTVGCSPDIGACHSVAERVDGLARGRLGLAQRRGLLVLLVVDRRVLLLGDPVELLLRLAQGGRRGRVAQADARRGLVDQVDRLVRQVAVGDVADRQVGGGLDRLVA